MTIPSREHDQTDEKPNTPRPSPNDVQPDGPTQRAPGDPDSVAQRHVEDVLKAEDDTVANEPSQSPNVND